MQKKPVWNVFFNFLMSNISSIKELLLKPSAIQWNITGTLPGKLKRKISCFILQDIAPWNHKNVRKYCFCGYFGALGNNVAFNGFLWFHEFLKISASIFWLKTDFNKVSSEKTFYVQITIVPGDIDAKKTRKTFHKLHINLKCI